MRLEARNVFIDDTPLPSIVEMSISDAMQFFTSLKLEGQKAKIAEKVMKEINDRLHFLVNVGLNYLNLSRSADTLSGGERQRVWLAMLLAQRTKYLLLDEPLSALDIGHQIEMLTLIKRLSSTLNIGVIIVIHDINMAARFCDHIIALHSGELLVEGEVDEVFKESILKRHLPAILWQWLVLMMSTSAKRLLALMSQKLYRSSRLMNPPCK